MVSIRNHIHQNPELSFREFKTSKFISAQLKKHGIKHRTGIAKTGIVAIIEGNLPDAAHGRRTKGKTVALRADMDALPILEKNKFLIPYEYTFLEFT